MKGNFIDCLYIPNIGATTIQNPNLLLDSNGDLGIVISGSVESTLVKTIIIKAQTETETGAVRIFVKKNSSKETFLIREFHIPPIKKSAKDVSPYIVYSINFLLESKDILLASTEKANTFNIIAEAFDFVNNTAEKGKSFKFISRNRVGAIETANQHLDGSGAITRIFSAGSSEKGFKGCSISTILVKGHGISIPGIVRLFYQPEKGGIPFLFSEIIVPATIPYELEIIKGGSFYIPSGSSIWASTALNQFIIVTIQGDDWQYA